MFFLQCGHRRGLLRDPGRRRTRSEEDVGAVATGQSDRLGSSLRYGSTRRGTGNAGVHARLRVLTIALSMDLAVQQLLMMLDGLHFCVDEGADFVGLRHIEPRTEGRGLVDRIP
jgi:hypothetical protein